MSHLKPGAILFDKQFEFKDKELGMKLIVLLNEPRKDEPYLFCRVTSKEKHPYRVSYPEGCQQRGRYFYISKKANVFPANTWIQLEEIFEYKAFVILSKHFKKEIETKNNLSIHFLKAIKNCISQSFDISEEHINMIEETILYDKTISNK